MTRAEINGQNAQKSAGPRSADEILDTVTLVKTRDVMMRSISNLSLHGHRLSRQFQKTRTELLEIQQQNKQENPAGFVFTNPVEDAPEPPEILPAHLQPETDDESTLIVQPHV